MESRIPRIIDLNADLAKLTMFRGLTPTNDAGGAPGQRCSLFTPDLPGRRWLRMKSLIRGSDAGR